MSAASSPAQVSATAQPTGRALVPFVAVRQAVRTWSPWRIGLVVVAFGLALGAGGAGAYASRHMLRWPGSAPPTASAAMVHQLQDQIGKLQESLNALRTAADAARPEEQLRGLKKTVEALKQDVEQARSNSATNVAQLSAKIEKAEHDPSPKLAEIATRLDRIEKQGATPTVTGSIPPVAHPAAAPQAAAKPDAVASAPAKPLVTTITAPLKAASAIAPGKNEVTQVAATPAASAPLDRPATVSGWVLRDVYDGMALVEARGGGLREVEPGQYLPGAGQVRSIERRGRAWVVMTSRGVIDDKTF